MPAALIQASDEGKIAAFLGDCPDAGEYGVTIVPETTYVSDKQIDLMLVLVESKLEDEQEYRGTILGECDGDEQHRDVKDLDVYLAELRELLAVLRAAEGAA